MTRLKLNTAAPDFSLTDTEGNTVRLSQYKSLKNVYLVLNRSLM